MRTLKEATTDKEVKRVTVSKEYITIFFTDQTEVKASKDEYFDNYLYPGTIIKKEEMNRLLKEEEIISAYIYLKRITAKRDYFISSLKMKIKEKYSLCDEDIEYLIRKLEKEGIIDEEKLINNYVYEMYEKGYSKRYIENKLKERNCFSPLTYDFLIYDREYFLLLIEDLYRKLKNKRGDPFCQIERSLLSMGYKKEEYNSYLEYFFSSLNDEEKMKNEEKKISSLKEEINRLFFKEEKNLKKDRRKTEAKMISSLLKKGYKYEDIIFQVTCSHHL